MKRTSRTPSAGTEMEYAPIASVMTHLVASPWTRMVAPTIPSPVEASVTVPVTVISCAKAVAVTTSNRPVKNSLIFFM